MADAPFGHIASRIKSGKVTTFLGAGASLIGRKSDTQWTAETHTILPKGRELSLYLAQAANFPSVDSRDREDLAKVASWFEFQNSRLDLDEELAGIFHKSTARPGRVHRFLAHIESPMLIVTTNYDTLIEDAFTEARRPFHLVTHPAADSGDAASVYWWKPGAKEPVIEPVNTLSLELDHPVIYKMHGSVIAQKTEYESFVITEEDYIDFLSKMTYQVAIPSPFRFHFARTNLLFLGYGLADWNLRVLLQNIRSGRIAAQAPDIFSSPRMQRGQAGAWAIQLHPSELERGLWKQRNVSIYDQDLDQFIERLEQELSTTTQPDQQTPS